MNGTFRLGATLVLLARFTGAAAIDLMLREHVDVFHGVPTMYVGLVEAAAGRDALPALRLCISGGEPRNEAAFSRWQQLAGCPVHDVYAASECFPVVTYDPFDDPQPRPGSAGRVVAEAALRLVDPEGQDVPAGATGEAWTSRPGPAGYWRDLRPHGAGPDAGRLVPTGDLARIDDEGYVHVVGRVSTMIIRGGSNVSPAEVEAVLRDHPDVREAAVVGLPDARYGEEVAAAVVLEPAAVLDAAALRAHCAAVLAGYKVPSRVVEVEQLPRNPHTGKVQRTDVVALLPAPPGRRSNRDRHAAGRRGAAGAGAEPDPSTCHARGRGRRPGGGPAPSWSCLELASTGLLASDPDAALLRVADVPAAYRRLPALRRALADELRELATTHGLTVLGGSHYRRAADGSYRNTAPHADGRAERQDSPPDAAGAGDGHNPGDEVLVTRIGPATVAVQICADIELPEVSRHRPSTASTWSSARR
jgi:hypothetical protein